MILTGGPGTGKTTTLNAIISIYESKGDRVMITAPTGVPQKEFQNLQVMMQELYTVCLRLSLIQPEI